MSRPEVWLLRASKVRLGGDQEQDCISLGHDAIAIVAREFDEEQQRQARAARWLAAVVGIGAVAGVMLLLSLFALDQTKKANFARNESDLRLAHSLNTTGGILCVHRPQTTPCLQAITM
jgi:hypothetical protein